MMRIVLVFVLFASLSAKTIAQLPQCDGSHFPMLLPDGSKGGSTSCCQKGIDFFLTASGNRFGHRQIGQVCSKVDPSINSNRAGGLSRTRDELEPQMDVIHHTTVVINVSLVGSRSIVTEQTGMPA